jgi:hypothetical protein
MGILRPLSVLICLVPPNARAPARSIRASPYKKNKKGLPLRLRIFVACSIAALAAAPALAGPVTYEFGGTAAGQDLFGDYFHDFGIPYFTSITGQITLESDTTPYYEDASQQSYSEVVTSIDMQFGAGGLFGTYTGPQVPPPTGWNSSSMSLFSGTYADGTPYDAMNIYGTLAPQPGDAANVLYRFLLWDTSTQDVFDRFPTLDQLPNKDAFGPPPMGLDIIATHYDDAGRWLGQTTLLVNLSSFQVVTSVPEPGTWALFVAGLLAVFFARHSRRAHPAFNYARHR